jgi:hypothetical protein
LQLVAPTLVELVLIEVLGTLVTGLSLIGRLEGPVPLDGSDRLLDPSAFICEQLAGAVWVHD